MIRFAVQMPEMLNVSPDADFNGARQEFVRLFQPVIYVPRGRSRLNRGSGIRKLLRNSPIVNADAVDFAFTERELNRKADVLIHFNRFPVDLSILTPPRRFDGMKVWHVYEYVFHPAAVNKLLERGGVDYLLGYTDHGRYCAFFRKAFPRFVDRVIPYPFGTSKRFLVDVSWQERKAKVIALGSINLVNEPNVKDDALRDYASFYSDHQFAHEWRRILAENAEPLSGMMDSQLPVFPEMKNPHYDAVKMLTSYALFANDEGLLAFPPARTFEGPAAGAAMIAADFGGYHDLGFRHGVNCVLHRKHDVDDFREKGSYYLNRPDELRRIAEAGRDLVRTHYTHAAVARRLATQLEEAFSSGGKPATTLAVEQPQGGKLDSALA